MKSGFLIILNLMILCVLIEPAPANASGGSKYGITGIGDLRFNHSIRALGMGGIGLAVPIRTELDWVNMATWVDIKRTTFSGSYTFEGIESSGLNFYNSRINNILFAVPLGSKAAFGGGFSPVSIVDYEFELIGQTSEGVEFQDELTGSGGLTNGFVGLSFTISNQIYVSGRFDALFGEINDIFQRDYSNEFLDTREDISSTMNGTRLTIGALYKWNKINFGGIVSSSTKIETKTVTEFQSWSRQIITNRISTIELSNDTSRSEIKIPVTYGLGISYLLGKRLLIGSDYVIGKWSDFKIDDIKPANTQDDIRFTLGIEWQGIRDKLNVSYINKIDYRLGLGTRQLNIKDITGNSVDEQFVTFGAGLPFFGNTSQLDFAFEYGKRGDSGDKESITKFSISITGTERWFVRLRR